jgi:hypothetical protein
MLFGKLRSMDKRENLVWVDHPIVTVDPIWTRLLRLPTRHGAYAGGTTVSEATLVSSTKLLSYVDVS